MKTQLRESVVIIGRHGSMILPTGTGYDREVLIDHLSEAVQRHGNAVVVSPNGRFSVALASKESARKCSSCRAIARGLAASSGGNLLCLRCVLRRLSRRIGRPSQTTAIGHAT